MKTVLLISLFILFGEFQETAVAQTALDSLIHANARYTKQDAGKLNLLNRLAEQYVDYDPEKGISIAEEAMALAQKLRVDKAYVKALNVKAENLLEQRSFQAADSLLLIALDINQSINNTNGIADNYRNKGRSATLKDDFNQSEQWYEKALFLYEETGNNTGKARCWHGLGWISNSKGEYTKALEQYEKALQLAQSISYQSLIAKASNNIGNVYNRLSEYPKALEYFLKALTINEELGSSREKANNYGNIGTVYNSLSDYPKALEYYQKALSINEELKRKINIANNLGNIGIVYYWLSDYPKALEYFRASLAIYEELGEKRGIATIFENIAIVYFLLSDYPKALEYYRASLTINEEIGDKQGMAINFHNLGSLYLDAPDSLLIQMGIPLSERYEKALEYTQKALDIHNEIESIDGQRSNWQNLSTIYEKQGKYEKAFDAYKNYIILRDSIVNEEIKNQIVRKEMQFEFDKKITADSLNFLAANALQKKEIERQRTLRNGFMSGFVLVAVFAGVFFTQRVRISKEKARSEGLLLNILPSEVAEELKSRGEAAARQYESATVLFTDFLDFTQITENMAPEELIGEINHCFMAFDQIMNANGLEKIKTIGDAYMAASGLPTPDAGHAKKALKAALQIRDFVEDYRQKGGKFDIRIGLSSGPVVAGVVGTSKFAYDLWGDTVNTASRMESSGEPGKVNISQSTYELLKDDAGFAFEYRGKISAKGKGDIIMYFAKRRYT